MTGILPIKKYGTQSALTDFYEFTMLEPGILADFVGFTEKEVLNLCQKYKLDFEKIKHWYDGYRFDKLIHVYNPNSIMKAIHHKKMGNYWTNTETYESLKVYIDLNHDGLKDAIIDMLGGKECRLDIGTFQNDLISLNSRDDVLTLLVHLGYLAYNAESRCVFIPNEEVREEFIRAIKHGSRKELVKIIERSDYLLDATLRMDLSCVDHYLKFEELASGKGFTDILLLPNRTSAMPALLIELKWNKSAEGAITQIKDNDYMQFTKKMGYAGDLLLIGINYDSKTQKHICRIEKICIPQKR